MTDEEIKQYGQVRYNRLLRRIEKRDAKIAGMKQRIIHLECLLSSARIDLAKVSRINHLLLEDTK